MSRNQCAGCGKKYGLVTYWYALRKFCSHKCIRDYKLYLQQEVRKRDFLRWLFEEKSTS